MNLRIVCRLMGLLLGVYTLAMSIGIPVAMAHGEWRDLGVLVESMVIGLIVAGVLFAIGWRARGEVYRRETLATVGLSWLFAAGIGALPFWLSGMVPSYTDAYFECMSGMTTTGATVLTTIEDKSASILMWRSTTQFIGGLGIVVLVVAVLPMVGVGGRVLFKQEIASPRPEGLTPRIKDTALAILKLYLIMTAAAFLCLWIAGMGFIDAIKHSFTTIATGGFSNRDASIASFRSPLIEWIIIGFMFLGATSFTLHLSALKGKFVYWRSTEFRMYVFVALGAALVITAILWLSGNLYVSNTGAINFRDSLFATMTVLTTTGFATQDFDQWPDAARMILLALMFFGGCAGSTSGSIKMIRWVILFKIARHELRKNISPRRVSVLKLDGQPMSNDLIRQVLSFYFIYTAVAFVAMIVLALLEPNASLVTIISSAASAINNIGPGLDGVGPSSNFAFFSAPSKWILSLLMIIGRLELFAILVLFSRSFWTGR